MSGTPLRILCFAGSTRAGSFNARLARFCADRLRELGAEAEYFDLRALPLPLFDQDLEAERVPANAQALAAAVDAADGVLLACPEYNAGMTGVLKNALDWCSRIPSAHGRPRVFTEKPVALVAASPGRLGGIRGLAHTRLVLIEMGAHVSPVDCAVGAAHEALGEDGTPAAPATAELLDKTLARLLDLAGRMRG